MKRFFYFLRPAVVVFALVWICANARGSNPHKPTAKKPPLAHQHTEVRSINAKAGTVVLREVGPETKDHTLLVDQWTEVTVNDQKATLAALKPGAWVDYVLKDENTLASITSVPSQPTPSPSPGKHK